MTTIFRASHPALRDAGIRFESGISKQRVIDMMRDNRETLPVDYRDVPVREIPASR